MTFSPPPDNFTVVDNVGISISADIQAKPFIHWVGGKRQLIDEISSRIPKTFNDYHECFVGGGAVLWNMLGAYSGKKFYASDYNAELTNLYAIVRDKVDDLIVVLKEYSKNHTKEYFLKVRGMDRDADYNDKPAVIRAARFLYLNRMGFNGLYRVNSKGYNNVPIGSKTIYEFDADNLRRCSQALEMVVIGTGDFETALSRVKPNDFVYLDPPYIPLTKTSNFTSYTKVGFTIDDQERLKAACDRLTKIGAKFLLSNSSAEIIFDLYKDYTVDMVKANRLISSDASKRGSVSEVLIRNY